MTVTGGRRSGMGSNGDMAAAPQPIGVGPETRALSRFYPDVTWDGTAHAGGMGPGTPAVTGVGRGTVQAIHDGRWIVLDCEQDQFLPDGTLVLKWQLHWVTGWSPEHGEYRAVMTDNDGHAELYRGRIDGDRLVFDSMEGAAPRLRFTWDVSDPGPHHLAQRNGGRRWVMVSHQGWRGPEDPGRGPHPGHAGRNGLDMAVGAPRR